MKWRWHMAQSLGGKLWGVQNGKVQCFVCFNTRKRIVAVEKEKWITRVSIPLPIACKAIALPFELITRNSLSVYCTDYTEKTERQTMKGRTSNLTNSERSLRPNAFNETTSIGMLSISFAIAWSKSIQHSLMSILSNLLFIRKQKSNRVQWSW